MRCLIRIPFHTEYAWVVKFYHWQNRHNLESDGVTVRQTAKDRIGEILTSYMKKTLFDPWYMALPSRPHLRVSLPIAYNRYGLTRGDLEAISDILKKFAQDQLCLMVMIQASLPGVNREQVIRAIWEMIGLTDDDYDMEHFRRYFDRYGKNSVGSEFLDFQREVTRVLKVIYDRDFRG
jgi:hypothetical protein